MMPISDKAPPITLSTWKLGVAKSCMTRHRPKTVLETGAFWRVWRGSFWIICMAAPRHFSSTYLKHFVALQYQTKEGHRGVLSSFPYHTKPFHISITLIQIPDSQTREAASVRNRVDSSGQTTGHWKLLSSHHHQRTPKAKLSFQLLSSSHGSP